MSDKREERSKPEGVVFGLMLILIGALFLLDRLDRVQLGHYWEWWPLLIIAFGLSRVAGWRSARSVASGVSWTLFGGWFMAVESGWFGLDWSNSWPLALVAVGSSIVLRAMLEPLFRRDEGADNAPGGEKHA